MRSERDRLITHGPTMRRLHGRDRISIKRESFLEFSHMFWENDTTWGQRDIEKVIGIFD